MPNKRHPSPSLKSTGHRKHVGWRLRWGPHLGSANSTRQGHGNAVTQRIIFHYYNEGLKSILPYPLISPPTPTLGPVHEIECAHRPNLVLGAWEIPGGFQVFIPDQKAEESGQWHHGGRQ